MIHHGRRRGVTRAERARWRRTADRPANREPQRTPSCRPERAQDESRSYRGGGMTQIGGVPSARKSGPEKNGAREDGSTRTSKSSSTTETNSSIAVIRPVASSTAATPHFSEPI